jgi:LysR family transcriptional regulator, regulator of gene expression of beta-lactamase
MVLPLLTKLTLTEMFDRLVRLLSQFGDGKRREPLTISVVETFALGWLLPRIKEFEQDCPFIDLPLLTNNNLADIASEGMDAAIRIGNGVWTGLDATRLIDAAMSPLCSPAIARRLSHPADVAPIAPARSYRGQNSLRWLHEAGQGHNSLAGPMLICLS